MKSTSLKLFVHLSWLAFLALTSCQKENLGTPNLASIQQQTELAARDNSQMVAVAQDALNVTGAALAGKGISNGRIATDQEVSDHDMDCAPNVSSTFTIDHSNADSIVYSGTLTIDYGTGAMCQDSTEIRKGKITDAFKLIVHLKDSITYNLTESVSFQGYQKDSVKVDGVFLATSTSGAMTTLTIQDAKLTYADGTFVSWNGSLTNKYMNEGFHERSQESRQVTGSISGTNRSGATFSASITKAILFEYSCSRNIPVSGTVDLTTGSVTSTVDYGTGTCDKAYTITTGGTTTAYTFNRQHHS